MVLNFKVMHKKYTNVYVLHLLHNFLCVRHFDVDELCKMEPY